MHDARGAFRYSILINFYFFCFPHRKIPDGRYVDVLKPSTFASFRPLEETVFIVHGFNGTARDKHMRYLKDGNLITVDFIFIMYFKQTKIYVLSIPN